MRGAWEGATRLPAAPPNTTLHSLYNDSLRCRQKTLQPRRLLGHLPVASLNRSAATLRVPPATLL